MPDIDRSFPQPLGDVKKTKGDTFIIIVGGLGDKWSVSRAQLLRVEVGWKKGPDM